MSKPKQLFWIGARDAAGQPLEYFGGVAGVRDPIPARDLTPEETAELTEAQWECIDSPTGKRLYSTGATPTKQIASKARKKKETEPQTEDPQQDNSTSESTDAPPADA